MSGATAREGLRLALLNLAPQGLTLLNLALLNLALLNLVLLGGCPTTATEPFATPTPPPPLTTSGVWLESMGFRWRDTQHRLSRVWFEPQSELVRVAVAGGNGTTDQPASHSLPGGVCDDCVETPEVDFYAPTATRAWTESQQVVYAQRPFSFFISADEERVERAIPLPPGVDPESQAVALIAGWGIDSRAPLRLGADACYDPVSGWLPRALTLAIEEVELAPAGEAVHFTLAGRFEAGQGSVAQTLCHDDVADRARVELSMTVLVVVAPPATAVVEREVVSEASYECGNCPSAPRPQPAPELQALELGLAPERTVAGWSALGFAFQQADEEADPGAWLRRLELTLDVVGDQAGAHAQSFAPGRQTADFQYRFDGRVHALETDREVLREEHSAPDRPVADAEGAILEHSF